MRGCARRGAAWRSCAAPASCSPSSTRNWPKRRASPVDEQQNRGAELAAARAAAPSPRDADRPQGQGDVVVALHAHRGADAGGRDHARDAHRRVDSGALREGRRHAEERRGGAEVGRRGCVGGVPHPGMATAELVGKRYTFCPISRFIPFQHVREKEKVRTFTS